MDVYLGGLVQAPVKDLNLPVAGLAIPDHGNLALTRLLFRQPSWMPKGTNWILLTLGSCLA